MAWSPQYRPPIALTVRNDSTSSSVWQEAPLKMEVSEKQSIEW
jgi:hypothetical protein